MLAAHVRTAVARWQHSTPFMGKGGRRKAVDGPHSVRSPHQRHNARL